jgi:hypothetical protein
MPCYISSNDNRLYAALEQSLGAVGSVAAENRIPAVKLGVKSAVELPSRRDKTGGRTYVGMPSGFRKRVNFDVTTYMAGWEDATPEPSYGPLFQAALGGVPVGFAGIGVQSAATPTRIGTNGPHGLLVGQAVRFGGEIRFVEAIPDATTIILNAPFTSQVTAGTTLGETVTYMPASSLASVTLYDFWAPQAAVQRVIRGGAINQLQIALNGDFHQFSFAGEAVDLLDSNNFTGGLAGLSSFPTEPAVTAGSFSLVPGSLGQAWFGPSATQFNTVVEAQVTLDNNLDMRRREFGSMQASCIVAGMRSVSVDLLLVSNTLPETLALHQASAQRSPVSMMLQLGEQERQLCGIYAPAVIPEVPEFEDRETRLQWRFRNNRAQGTANDELIIAFA